MTDAYKSKASGNRAKGVALDQANSAIAQGRSEAYRQLLDRDEVESITKRWQKSPRRNDREDHKAMDGTTIQLDEKFQFADVAMDGPHDPAGGPAHNMFCGCVAIYRVKYARD